MSDFQRSEQLQRNRREWISLKEARRSAEACADDWHLPPYTVENVFVAHSQVVDWGVLALGVPSLWTDAAGENVTVAVLDTGNPDHPDLQGVVQLAKDFTGSQNGVRDLQGHSTHCCGIIAARDNALGVVGVAPKANLVIGKVLGDSGSGSSQSVAAGIQWAADQGVDIISMSLGSPQADSSIKAAIQYAVAKGVYVVVAAGNSGPGPNTVEYPGRWPEVIAVASTNQSGKVSSYSSRGPEVDIAAPGEQITSTYLNGTLAKLSGTSMATPFVAGIIALALSKYKKIGRDDPANPVRPTPKQMIERLQKCVTDMDSPGFDFNAGWGLIDPSKLVGGFQPTPVPPVVTPPPVTPMPPITIGTLIVQGKELQVTHNGVRIV